MYSAEVYTSDGSGGVTWLRGFSNWRSGLSAIVPGDFGGDGHTDLLFYERPR